MGNTLDALTVMQGRLWTGLLLFGLIVAFALLTMTVVRLREWFRDGDGPADDDDAFLAALLDSQREGVVSREEFRSIQGEVARRQQPQVRSSGDGSEEPGPATGSVVSGSPTPDDAESPDRQANLEPSSSQTFPSQTLSGNGLPPRQHG